MEDVSEMGVHPFHPNSKSCCCATLLPYCANAALPYPMYAGGRRLLVFVPLLTVWQRVKKGFDTLTGELYLPVILTFFS